MRTPDFFRSRLDTMIDLRHPLAVLATRMPWESIEASPVPLFERKPRPGAVISESDLFGQTVQLAGAVSAAGRPRLSIRLMVSLLYPRATSHSSSAGQRTSNGSSQRHDVLRATPAVRRDADRALQASAG